MRSKAILFSGLVATMLFACETKGEDQTKDKKTNNEKEVQEKAEKKEMKKDNELLVVMDAKSGSKVSGNISLKEKAGSVKMKVDVKGLKPGAHAIHIHEKGDCSSEDGKSAGGHWNPTGHDHGEWGKEAFHMGDIGNLEANEEGVASLEFETDKWCIGCDDETKNIIGKSFIIHAGADDFKSQPSGAAGARVACGLIKK